MKHLTGIIFALLLTTFASCKKEMENLPDASATYSRILTFPNRNNAVKTQVYTSANRLEASAQTGNDKLQLFLDGTPKTDGSNGESMWLELDAPALSTALVRTYRFSDGIHNARFVYQLRNNTSDIWGSITEKAMGVAFAGTVSITAFNPKHRTISGTYHIEVRGLLNDPTERGIANSIDPQNLCDLVVEGTFENIKVKD